MKRKPQVTVIGDAIADAEKYSFSEKVGVMLAKLGCTVITGGRTGVMEAVCKGVSENGGTAIGIIPSDRIEHANDYCTAVIPTALGHARNSMTVMSADVVIAIGGGAGTLSEMSFAWIYNRPVLASTKFDGWSRELADRSLDLRRQDTIVGFNDLDDLKVKLMGFFNQLGII